MSRSAVAVVIEKSAARADRFNDEFLAVGPIDVDEGNARFLGGVVEARIGVEGEGCKQ